MVPRLLRLRNFMSYGDDPVALSFDGIHMACLSGANGNGKSALLDAITWVLWGRSRARREDDLVFHGAREMEVQLEFSLAAATYRVLRKRTLRPSGGTAALELQVMGEGGYSSITGATINETQARITDILKLGYDTFINSTFLLQGRADEFTVKPAAQRKAVLGEILGLAQYDRLADRARERARQVAARASAARDSIATVEVEVARGPALRDELAEVERCRVVADGVAHEAERVLWALRGERQRVENDERSLHDALRYIRTLSNDLQTLRQRCDDAERTAAAAQRLLDDEDRINASAQELSDTRHALAVMGERAGRAMELEREAASARQEIDSEAARLREAENAALIEATKRAGAADEADALRREVDRYADCGVRLDSRKQEQSALALQIQTAREELAGLDGANKRLAEEMRPLRERLKLLKEPGAGCPVCGKAMGEDERRGVYRQFETEGLAKRTRLSENEARMGDLKLRITELESHASHVKSDIAALEAQARALSELGPRLDQALKTSADEREYRALADQARRTLDSSDFAHDARTRLEACLDAIRAVGFDPAQYDALRRRVDNLAPVETQVAALATARERRGAALETIAAAQEDLSGRTRELSEVQARVAALRDSVATLPEIDRQLGAAENAFSDAKGRVEALGRQSAALTERLRSLAEAESALRGRRAEAARLEQQSDAYAELGRVFGKSGIQAMIIDNALPALEDGANEILSRMSDNGMQVQFATQAQGARGDLLETLEIRIADANGTRPYEMFSGGEAFRVNFAIRVALSRLLAERAGARLQMLVIDEGFGTQDSQGRERLAQAINSIAADFEKIIVITHIDELKDMFNTRIDVVKDVSGSRVSVTAA